MSTTPHGAESVRWNLHDLYPAPDAPELAADMQTAERLATTFAETYRGKIAELDAAQLATAVEAFENIITLLTKLGSYAYLIWSTDTQNPALGKLMAQVEEHSTQIHQMVLFFELEWANAPESSAALVDDPALARYQHYLKLERRMQPYTRSEPEEKILSQMELTGASGWTRYFSEVMSNLRFPYEGQELTQSEILTKSKDPDRSVRQKAADSVTGVLAANTHATTFIFNMILLDKASKDRIRGFQSWISARNLANQVEDEPVAALIDAVTNRYDIVARYYRLLKTRLGYDELFDYDRYAPLESVKKEVSWSAAQDMVLNAFGGFDPRMAEIAAQFFDQQWIDAAIVPGKMGGAYSASTSAQVHPYIFMNFDGDLNSVMTLAHELGHGVHQFLAREQGELQSNTPLTTSEMASTFGEMLVFDYLMERENDPKVRFAMRMEKISDTFATIQRQIAMNRFEHTIHTARREQGELDTDQLSAMWLETQRAMFGESVTLRDDYRLWWSYIPHFLRTPGYVYAYAFGELLVWALYARYQQSSSGFGDQYMQVLRAGGADYPHNILKPLGVDLQDPKFWHEGLDLLEGFIAQTEADAAQL